MLCIPDKTVSDYTKDIQMSEAHGGGDTYRVIEGKPEGKRAL